MPPVSVGISSSNSKLTGYEGVGSPGLLGGVHPLPGSYITTSVTIPTPDICFGHGGGIREADIPIGLSVQGLATAVPTLVFLVILIATTAGFWLKGAWKSKLVKITSILCFLMIVSMLFVSKIMTYIHILF